MLRRADAAARRFCAESVDPEHKPAKAGVQSSASDGTSVSELPTHRPKCSVQLPRERGLGNLASAGLALHCEE
jgi:hypothetical protein